MPEAGSVEPRSLPPPNDTAAAAAASDSDASVMTSSEKQWCACADNNFRPVRFSICSYVLLRLQPRAVFGVNSSQFYETLAHIYAHKPRPLTYFLSYSTLALVPPMSTMDVWRGITLC